MVPAIGTCLAVAALELQQWTKTVAAVTFAVIGLVHWTLAKAAASPSLLSLTEHRC